MTNRVNPFDIYSPLREDRFADGSKVLGSLAALADHGAPPDVLKGLWTALHGYVGSIDDPDETMRLLAKWVEGSRRPVDGLTRFEQDPRSLLILLRLLSTGPAVARFLIRDPESLDLIGALDARSTSRAVLGDELAQELRAIAPSGRAATAMGRFIGREHTRIIYREFFEGIAPDQAARQITHLSDAVLSAALDFTIERVATRLNRPRRIDGSEPRYAIIAMGNYAGEELGYDSPLDLLLLCDQIDRKNASDVKFNRHVARGLLRLLPSGRGPLVSVRLRFVQLPGDELQEVAFAGTDRLGDSMDADDSPRPIDFHTVNEVMAYYERENRTHDRLAWVKARVAAGDPDLGTGFLQRLEPWVYHRLLSRRDIADLWVLHRKIVRRALSTDTPGGKPIADCPGGQRDIEWTIQFLQLLHGGEIPEVRVPGTHDAIVALNRHGCLTQRAATILLENHARLCRLEHHLTVLMDHRPTHLPGDDAVRTRLAQRLGVRKSPDRPGEGCEVDNLATVGDRERFERLLDETFAANRQIIHDLMTQNAATMLEGAPGIEPASAAIPWNLADDAGALAMETELILDTDPDLDRFADVLRGHGFEDRDHAMKQLSSLSHETIPCLSPGRARYFLARAAPRLLREIAFTPGPNQTLDRLVEVADSIGAKGTLWELLATNQAMMSLMVKLCSLAPYLSGILSENPGMIDELLDSLLMDRLPPPERVDAQSIRLCQAADDVSPILRTFRAGYHLTIGTRDLLGKEAVDSIGRSLSDVAESCVRRVIESEHERLAARWGDPVNDQNEPAEMVAVALGEFGGRELSYHSDLDLTFVYTAEGDTRRRVGGPRSTLPHHEFFHRLAQNVVHQIARPRDPLYAINLPFVRGVEEAGLVYSIDQFTESFRLDEAPPWQRYALCRARPISGSRRTGDLVDAAIVNAIGTPSRASHGSELKSLRRRGESAAAPGDLKRGVGGTLDVQCIVAAGILKSAGRVSETGREAGTGLIAAIDDLAAAGVYGESDAEMLMDHYRYLRTVENKWHLIDTSARHELPLWSDGSPDPYEMKQLAALLGESDPAEIIRRCDEVRAANGELFDRLLASGS